MENKGLARLASAHAFIEITQIFAKILLNHAAFKPQVQQAKITAQGTSM
jgi:hypothetical protein